MNRLAPRLVWVIAIALITLIHAAPARAHEIRPALLDITETAEGWFDVTWKVPMVGDLSLRIVPILPPALEPVGPPSVRQIPGARVERLTCRGAAAALVGQEILIDGLSTVQIDVLLRLDLADCQSHSVILRPSSPRFVIPERATRARLLWTYMSLGIEHILGGVDHLLFVLGLLFLVRDRRMLIKTITSFTVAHSITLAIATLGYAHAQAEALNVLIAMSILFLGPEIIRACRGERSLTIDHPWIVAFAFGLLHGFGFASGLMDLGLSRTEIPMALLMFNVGVEVGQLGFVAILLAVGASLRTLGLAGASWIRVAPAYVIGSLGAYWTIDRLLVGLGF